MGDPDTVSYTHLGQPASKEITYDKFVEMVEEDQVRKVVIDSDTLVITPKEQKVEGMTLTYSCLLYTSRCV